MTPQETKNAVRILFGSQVKCARDLGFNPRSVRYWCQVGAPPHIVQMFQRIATEKISAVEARKFARDYRKRRLHVEIPPKMVDRKRRPSAQ